MESSTPEHEERLEGGAVTGAWRVGNTVRRPTRAWSSSVHALLRHLEKVAFAGAPRFHGIDDQGREILDFIDGVVPVHVEYDLFASDDVLFEVGALIRRLHDAVATFEVAPDALWRSGVGAPRAGEVICHGDISPWNLVLIDGRPSAFIDWDFASPAPPIRDVAYAAVHFTPMEPDEFCRRLGWVKPPNRRRRMNALCDGYGLSRHQRETLLDECIGVLTSAYERMKAGGDPDMVKAWNAGIGKLALGNIRFIEQHRHELAGRS